EEVLDFERKRSEAVDQLGTEGLDLALIVDLGEPSIQRQPNWKVGDIVVGDHDRSAYGDLRRPFVGSRRRDAGLETCDRLLQHLLIELEADLPDMAGLLLAQEISGAADVEVVGGERKACAQRVERLQHLQPPL